MPLDLRLPLVYKRVDNILAINLQTWKKKLTDTARNETFSRATETYSKSENSINTQHGTEDSAQKQIPLQFPELITNGNETSSHATETYSETSKSENSIREIDTQPKTEDPAQKQMPLQFPEPITNGNETSSHATETYSETSKSESSIREINTQHETEDPAQKQMPLQFSEPINNDQNADGQHSGDGPVSAKEDDNINDRSPNVKVSNIHRTIPNLYQLVELCLDKSTTSSVRKAIIHPEELEKVCNTLVPGSYRSVSDIQFNELADVDIQLIGCYGNYKIISKLLLQNKVIDKDRYEKFIKDEQSLAPGLYLLIIESDMNHQQSQETAVAAITKFGLVILWPEKHFYDEKEILTNATNLHRFLTRLTDHQICLMSEEDLRNFSFSNTNLTNASRLVNIKVKTNRKQEKGVSVGKNGFEIKVPELAICSGDPSKAFIIESNTLQSLAVMQNISESTTMSKGMTKKFNSSYEFQGFLKRKLDEEHYALSLSDLSMDKLDLLINEGLAKPDLLVEYKNKISDLIKQRDEKINEYKKIVNQWALSTLKNYDILFKKGLFSFNTSSIKDNLDLQELYVGHAEVCKDIEAKIIQIGSKEWKSLKREFCNKKKQLANSKAKSALSTVCNVLTNSKNGIDTISDAKFIAVIVHIANETDIAKLQKEYQKWKDEENINKKLEECWKPHIKNMTEDRSFFKYAEKLYHLGKIESEKLKKKLESMYSAEKKMFVKNLQTYQRILELPDRIANANYTNTSLSTSYRNILYINASFEIRKLCQLDDGKFVLVLWDTEKNVYAIFYGTLPELKEKFKRDSVPSRVRLMDEPQDSLIAVNYSTGFMATYSNDECGVLNIYNIYGNETEVGPLYSNLVRKYQLSTLKHLLWIGESSMLFVKEDGEAYTFDYMNCCLNNFEKFPKDAASILSSPDCSCIFVFKQKTNENVNTAVSKIAGNVLVDTGEFSEGIEDKHPAVPVNTNEDTVQALVFFVKQGEPLEIEIPLSSHSLIHYRFMYFEQIQHFVALDLAHNLVVSAK
ncbi:7120_t:CDS:10, partial [Paraglomus brasilianum]